MATDRAPAVALAGEPGGVLPALAHIVHLVTGRDPEEVRPDHDFVEDLRVDSLAMVEILEGAAHHLRVQIEDEAAKRFVLVRDLVDYLTARL